MHGNRHGVNAAKSILDDLGGQVSVLFGHTHKLQSFTKRGEDFPVVSYGSGCLCGYPHYMKHGRMRGKWQLGTAIAEVDLNGREVIVHNLLFEKDRRRVYVRFERKLFEVQG
jgi:predicted phosphodiesterase